MINIDISTIIFQIINFLVLFGALYFLLFKNIIKRAEKRKKELEEIRQKAVDNYEESQRLRDEMERSVANIKSRVEEYISRAKSELEVDRFQIIEETKAQAEQIIQQARENARLAQARAIEDFQEDIMDNVIEIVHEILTKSIPEGFHDQLVEQINDRVWELGRKEMRRVDTIRKSLEDRDEPEVAVITAEPLTKEQQANVVRTFSALADKNVSLKIEQDESLIAGVRIRLGDFIVDNTLSSKLKEIREGAKEELGVQIKEMQSQ